jgi:hypothetical protein
MGSYKKCVTTPALKGIKRNAGNDAIEFPYFLHSPIGWPKVLQKYKSVIF